MGKILTTATLALALGVSTISYAGVSTFGVDTSEINRTVVTDQINSDTVESSYMSFYTSDKGNEVKSLPSGKEADKEYYYVFGVKIDSGSNI